MISFLALYKNKLLMVVGLIVIIAIGVGGYKFVKYEQNIGYQRAVAEYTARELAAAKATAAKQAELINQVKEAQNEASKRNEQVKKLSNDLNTTTSSLRNTITRLRGQVSDLTADAARRQADSALGVSGECAEEYTKMAEEAARLSSQLMLLQDAWPK